MLFGIAFLWNFVIGGLTGVYLSDVPADIQLHGGMFVTAHFHYTIVGGALMGFFAAVYYWFPKMTGRMLDDKLGWISFWLIRLASTSPSSRCFSLASRVCPAASPTTIPAFAGANFVTSIFAFVLIGGVAITFYNIVISWISGRRRPPTPGTALARMADGHPGPAGKLREDSSGHQLAV